MARAPSRLAQAFLLALAALALTGASAARAGHRDPFGWPARGRLGIQVQPMTEELREHFGAPPHRGVLVTRIEPTGPAARAGLRVADVIVAAAQEPVEHPRDLVFAVARAPEGKPLELRVVREGKPLTLQVVPQGEPLPWLHPEEWNDLTEQIERGFERGLRELRRTLEKIERRLEELERRMDARPMPGQEHT